MPVKVLTDHKGLKYFMTTKKLTSRQAKWAEFLSEFNFKVTYQTGKKNDKADALTRKPNKQPANEKDKQQEHKMQVLLPPERVELQPIEVSEPQKEPHAKQLAKPQAKKPKEFTNYAEAERHEEAKQEKSVEDKPEKAKKFRRLHATKPHAKPQPIKGNVEDKEGIEAKRNKEIEVEDLPTLPKQVKKANQKNALFTEIREYLANPNNFDRPAVYLRGSRAANGLLYKNNKLWVNDDLRLDVIQEVHDQPAIEHAGVQKTIFLIQQHYFWPKIKQDVNQYIRNCHICRRAKASQNQYNKTLKPLSVPERPWTDITMDFMTSLPECKLKNAILMVVNCLAKEQVYIP